MHSPIRAFPIDFTRFGQIIPVALLCAACASVPSRDAGAQTSAPMRTITHDGAQRRYLVRTPPGMAGDTTRRALVLVLHGGGGNAANAEEMTGFTALGRSEGFIVVYPEGSGRFRRGLLTWNAGHCCGSAMEHNVDDVGFIDALLDTLIENDRVDPTRVYVTGMSNGAMMTHRLGRELSHRFAGIAPVVGAVFGGEAPPRCPVSAVIINGALDKSVPAEGGAPGGRFSEKWDGTPAQPALAQASYWAAADGCDSTPEVIERDAVVLRRYRCPAGRTVDYYLMLDGGHAWPGGNPGSRWGDEPSRAMDATKVIWEAFRGLRTAPAP